MTTVSTQAELEAAEVAQAKVVAQHTVGLLTNALDNLATRINEQKVVLPAEEKQVISYEQAGYYLPNSGMHAVIDVRTL